MGMMLLLATTGLCALVGHVVLWTGLLNQIASRNLPSLVTRLSEKGLLLLAAGVPFWLGPWWFAGIVGGSLHDTPAWLALQAYVYACALLGLVALSRKVSERWWSTRVDVPTTSRVLRVRRADDSRRKPLHGGLTRLVGALPGNEICDLEVNDKELFVPGMAEELAGFTIAHLSDLHFTGRITAEFYRVVWDAVRAQQPDAIAITGDIIDEARCLDWLDMLGELKAPEGTYFVLGNHDKRLGNVEIVRRRLHDAGLVSLGGLAVPAVWRGQRVLLAGNELPWLGPPPPDVLPPGETALRLALLHTPDQLPWARRLGFQLALAGHTHGGQVRLPGIGAVLSPSRYGTRYACGVFHEPPTVLHVSRGVSALHPVRYACRPEITRLILRPAPA